MSRGKKRKWEFGMRKSERKGSGKGLEVGIRNAEVGKSGNGISEFGKRKFYLMP
jgi:hypothetical protein